MRTYETIFIVHPELVGESLAATVDKFKGILADQQADILKVEEWGTRKLAYPVKKQTRGSFVLVVFNAEAPVVSEFERRMRIDENIIKFQTVHLEKGYQAAPEKEVAPAAEGEESAAEETVENA